MRCAWLRNCCVGARVRGRHQLVARTPRTHARPPFPAPALSTVCVPATAVTRALAASPLTATAQFACVAVRDSVCGAQEEAGADSAHYPEGVSEENARRVATAAALLRAFCDSRKRAGAKGHTTLALTHTHTHTPTHRSLHVPRDRAPLAFNRVSLPSPVCVHHKAAAALPPRRPRRHAHKRLAAADEPAAARGQLGERAGDRGGRGSGGV